ncbi:MAG: hypothetical protein Tsb005_02050 [Gammaproteobacteria bacterium]
MTQTIKTDICIIGAGAGGLSVAAGAAQLGVDVTLIENHKMGGDCLNSGCVPSKSLLAAAHTAFSAKTSHRFGIQVPHYEVDFAKVLGHVHQVIERISHHDSVERFEGLGVRVIQASGEFCDSNTVKAGDKLIKARRFVIATGSSPAIPAIPGLAETPYLTNETIFELTEKPEHLIIVGGGPIGCEMAQAFLQLGTRVTLLEVAHILPKDDAELVGILRQHLINQGLNLYEQAQIKLVEPQQDGSINIQVAINNDLQSIKGSHLLIAAGRQANLKNLNLSAANIEHTSKHIVTDARLRTSNKKIYAIGDVTGPYQFTHMAGYHAGIIIKNVLFRIPAKVNYNAVPWVTYTSPELAQVGVTEAQAKQRNLHYQLVEWKFTENDRAQCELTTPGKIKVMVNRKGLILGVSMLGPHAGDLIQPWIIAMNNRLTIRKMAEYISPYPTFAEINKRAAGSYFTPLLFSDKTRRLVRWLRKLG